MRLLDSRTTGRAFFWYLNEFLHFSHYGYLNNAVGWLLLFRHVLAVPTSNSQSSDRLCWQFIVILLAAPDKWQSRDIERENGKCMALDYGFLWCDIMFSRGLPTCLRACSLYLHLCPEDWNGPCRISVPFAKEHGITSEKVAALMFTTVTVWNATWPTSNGPGLVSMLLVWIAMNNVFSGRRPKYNII